jgi:hypothetical protein
MEHKLFASSQSLPGSFNNFAEKLILQAIETACGYAHDKGDPALSQFI